MKAFTLFLRFLLELIAWIAPAVYCFHTANQWPLVQAIALSMALMSIWVIFAVPNDPSRSGKAPIPIPGKLRLAIEVLEFTLGIWALYALLPSIYGHLSLVVLVIHHLSYTDRLKWIWQQ